MTFRLFLALLSLSICASCTKPPGTKQEPDVMSVSPKQKKVVKVSLPIKKAKKGRVLEKDFANTCNLLAKEHITDVLKVPDSAEFPMTNIKRNTEEVDGEVFHHVIGEYFSKNAFNVRIRGHWRATSDKDNDGEYRVMRVAIVQDGGSERIVYFDKPNNYDVSLEIERIELKNEILSLEIVNTAMKIINGKYSDKFKSGSIKDLKTIVKNRPNSQSGIKAKTILDGLK